MKTGFINVYKAKCDGSTYVVNKIKKKINEKCGHMGTLDPLASGVLPVATNKATRLFDFLLNKKKTYVAEFTFGYATDTLDLEGRVVETGGRVPQLSEIKRVLATFCGEIEQVPPSFSAIMIDGKRSYDLARKGVEVNIPAKKVVIDGIEVQPTDNSKSYRFTVECRGGTYIRSLCRDIACRLGTVAVMTDLQRTAAGFFTKENSVSLKEFLASDNPEDYLIPADKALDFPKIVLSAEKAQRLLNGLRDEYSYSNGLYKVYSENEFWGVGEVCNGKIYMRAYVRE